MQPDIAVVGGGLLGRLLAWRASRAGVRVALYDAGGRLGENSAAWAAAGMITPTVESAGASSDVVAMGRHSLSLWPQWLAELPLPVFSRDNGSLVLWHEDDAGEASRFQAAVAASDAHADVRAVDGPQLHALEPLLDGRFSQALYVPDEWQIDNRELLQAVAAALEVERVECHWKTHIADGAFPAAEVIVDCRGMGARAGWPQLRGVRGEIVRLHAPGIALRHMLRLLHPRSPIYVVPRGEGKRRSLAGLSGRSAGVAVVGVFDPAWVERGAHPGVHDTGAACAARQRAGVSV
jgi:glycine oxidase